MYKFSNYRASNDIGNTRKTVYAIWFLLLVLHFFKSVTDVINIGLNYQLNRMENITMQLKLENEEIENKIALYKSLRYSEDKALQLGFIKEKNIQFIYPYDSR